MKSNGTKRTLFEKHSGLEQVVRLWYEEHDESRWEREDVSYGDLVVSFMDALQLQRDKDRRAGVVATVPKSLSVGWFDKLRKALRSKKMNTASTEVKRVTPEDNAIHFA